MVIWRNYILISDCPGFCSAAVTRFYHLKKCCLGEKESTNELTVHHIREVKAGTEAAPHPFHSHLGVERNGRVLSV